MQAVGRAVLQRAGLGCPECGERLAEASGQLRCHPCGTAYPVVDGIPCFVEEDAVFEGAWSHSVRLPSAYRPLRWILSTFQYYGVTSYLRRLVRGEGNLILDLGCGGGQELLTLNGQVVGVDVSRTSLAQAARFYQAVLAADARRLPFASEVFDYVVSVFLLEHFEPALKDRVISEMVRVLKPGGRLVVYTDTDSDKRLVRWAKRFPDLYRKSFVDQAGHVGLESAVEVARRFELPALEDVRARPKNTSSIIFPMSWVAWFDSDYTRHSATVSAAVRVSRWLTAHKRLNQIAESAVLVANRASDLIMPSRCASHVLVTCRKRAPKQQQTSADGPTGTPRAS